MDKMYFCKLVFCFCLNNFTCLNHYLEVDVISMVYVIILSMIRIFLSCLHYLPLPVVATYDLSKKVTNINDHYLTNLKSPLL